MALGVVLVLVLGRPGEGRGGCVHIARGGSPLTALGVGLGIWRGENRRDENEPQQRLWSVFGTYFVGLLLPGSSLVVLPSPIVRQM